MTNNSAMARAGAAHVKALKRSRIFERRIRDQLEALVSRARASHRARRAAAALRAMDEAAASELSIVTSVPSPGPDFRAIAGFRAGRCTYPPINPPMPGLAEPRNHEQPNLNGLPSRQTNTPSQGAWIEHHTLTQVVALAF